jgi:hypothetical protein
MARQKRHPARAIRVGARNRVNATIGLMVLGGTDRGLEAQPGGGGVVRPEKRGEGFQCAPAATVRVRPALPVPHGAISSRMA